MHATPFTYIQDKKYKRIWNGIINWLTMNIKASRTLQ